jgi:hypothetical protein
MKRQKKQILQFKGLWLFLILFAGCKKDPIFKYPAKPEVTINSGDERLQNSTLHFVKDTVYILATNINLASGQTFLIDAGTLIKVNNGISISVQPGATITAEANRQEPIVFTSSAGKGKPLGIAPGGNGSNAWGNFQIFGNTNGNSSGILSYVRMEFFSGLQLNSVSNQTTLNNLQVSYSSGNSFNFSGGNCNASNLVSYSATGSDFNIFNSYKGKLQQIFAYRYPVFANSQLNIAGINIEGAGTEPTISNATVLGPELSYGINPAYTLGSPYKRAGIITSADSRFHIRNSVVIAAPVLRDSANASQTDNNSSRAYYLDSRNTAASLDSGRADFTYSIFYQANYNTFYIPDRVYPIPQTTPVRYYNSSDLREFLLRTKYNNEIYLALSKFNLIDPYNYYDGIPNPFPNTSSPLLNGANFSDVSITPVFTDPFFKPVTYRGALGADDWLKGWVNFIPLQTDYNN